LNRLVDFDEILYGVYDIDDAEDYIDSVLLNIVATTTPKWRTSSEVGTNLNRLVIWMKFYMGSMALNITWTK
jgi:hypothetical protein